MVALTGELGAGKTLFVQGAAHALGVEQRVTSPSFILRREYVAAGGLGIVHLDVYRLDTLAEVADLGFEEIFDATRVTFIEWGDAMSALLPPDHLEVEFRLEPPALDTPAEALGGEPRRIVLRPRGHDWLRRVAELTGSLAAWRMADGALSKPPGEGA